LHDLCRNNYNNQTQYSSYNLVRNINNSSAATGVIEELIHQANKTTRDKMLVKGFDFEYFTRLYQPRTANYHFCYEYGYLPLDGDEILL